MYILLEELWEIVYCKWAVKTRTEYLEGRAAGGPALFPLVGCETMWVLELSRREFEGGAGWGPLSKELFMGGLCSPADRSELAIVAWVEVVAAETGERGGIAALIACRVPNWPIDPIPDPGTEDVVRYGEGLLRPSIGDTVDFGEIIGESAYKLPTPIQSFR